LVFGVALIVLSLVTVALQRRDGSPATTSAPAATTSTDTLARLEKKTQDSPNDPKAWAALGAGYVDHARVASDPTAYPKAQAALERALELDPNSWEALAASGALAAGRHDFTNALKFSEQALVFQPKSSFILGVIVDALTELGRYPEAVDAAQQMVDLRPNLSSYARVSYQRELHGDVPGAVAAMESALRASSSVGNKTFALYHLGQLAWDQGDLDGAAANYQAAVELDPKAAQAMAGLGKVSAARGDFDAAIAQYEQATAIYPDPELLKELGELYVVTGNPALADARFQQFSEANAAQAAGGTDINLETALFSADDQRDLDGGLAAAQQEWERRKSIHVADALGWQLFQHGRYDEALLYSNEALELGTRNASFIFHRAEIERALGDRDAALADYQDAVALNPNFSFLHRDTAKEAIAALSN
jgi:tetratricopeptide (TPR) repeat protein